MVPFNHKFDYILLDLDGTLVDSPRLGFLIRNTFMLYRRFYKLFGVTKTFSIVQTGIRAMLRNDPKCGKKNYDVLLETCHRASAKEISTIATELSEFYQKDFLSWSSLFTAVPGAKDFVQNAKKQNIKMYIWTNPIWPEFNVKKRLEWAGFSTDDFLGFTHSQNMMACKPNVAYFKHALQIFNLDPAKCILIGDSEKKDGPARLCGIETIILSNDKRQSWDEITQILL